MSDEQRPDEVADVEGHVLGKRDDGVPPLDDGEGVLGKRTADGDDGPDVEGHVLGR